MGSTSRISLSDLNPPALTKRPQQKTSTAKDDQVEEATTDETEDVLEVESIETSKVNDATEPAQAIINSLSVDPDLEKATKTKKRRSKKTTKATSSAKKSKTSSRTKKTSSKKTKN